MIRTAYLAALVVALAGCGGESTDATSVAATGALTEAECTLLAERHRDYATSVAPAGQEDAMRAFADAGFPVMVADCTAGEMFDRQAYDCVAKAPAGSAESHACITSAHGRG